MPTAKYASALNGSPFWTAIAVYTAPPITETAVAIKQAVEKMLRLPALLLMIYPEVSAAVAAAAEKKSAVGVWKSTMAAVTVKKPRKMMVTYASGVNL